MRFGGNDHDSANAYPRFAQRKWMDKLLPTYTARVPAIGILVIYGELICNLAKITKWPSM